MAGTLYLILLIVSFQFDSLFAEASFLYSIQRTGEKRPLSWVETVFDESAGRNRGRKS